METTETKLKGLNEALQKITCGFYIVTARKEAKELSG